MRTLEGSLVFALALFSWVLPKYIGRITMPFHRYSHRWIFAVSVVVSHYFYQPAIAFTGALLFQGTRTTRTPRQPPGVFFKKMDLENDIGSSLWQSNNNGTAIDPYIDIASQQYDGLRPDASWNLAGSNFRRQGATILQQIIDRLRNSKEPQLPDALGLSLSNVAVTKAEERRIAVTGGIPNVHPVSQALYQLGCAMLDTLFDERPIQRFWFLEIVARIPYFSYVSMLHLYESLGWWRAVELRKVHAAEEWNELHHLLIMESLGGNSAWSDRFLGYHAAILYYWLLILVFLGSPRIAYQFMELLESHAVDTYSTFVEENKERLKRLPPPQVAISYYASGDLYLFDDFQVSRAPGSRRPPCENLYDVFCNIANDEGEHVKTMAACQSYALDGTPVVSPHVGFPTDDQRQSDEKRRLWKQWSDEVNQRSTEMDGF